MSLDTHDYNGEQLDLDYERESEKAGLEAHLHFTVQDFIELEERYGHVFMMQKLAEARNARRR